MAILKCKMCGGDLNVTEEASVCECAYCGTKQTVPTADDEKKLNLFNRATRLRIGGEFDKAAALYESLVAEFPEEAEAYWGLVICHYGIEYVSDPATGRRIPTCHRASFDPVANNENFQMAMEYADVMAQKVYRDEAREIDRIREEILSVCKDEKPYDIFICYKESDDKGGRTIDSVIAQDAYDALTDKGYRVFFSRISLEDKLGSQYEPFIFSALNSARIMLVFGTKYEYFHAVWVKNEWSRFLKLMAKDKSKVLIPCYKEMDAYDMPDEFHALQAQDMGKVGAMQDLLRGIEKILGETKTAPQETIMVANNVTPLMERAFMFLEDGEWDKADQFCEQVLNQNPKCGEAYLGKLMAELRKTTREELKECALPFDQYSNYQKAMRFGDEALQAELQGYLDFITKHNQQKAYHSAVETMNHAQSEEDYLIAAKRLSEFGDYADAPQLVEQCHAKAEAARKDAIYHKASAHAAKKDDDSLRQAISLFASISDWNDADEQIQTCQKKMKEIEEEKRRHAEEKEKAEERRAELQAQRIKTFRRCIGIFAIIILLWTFALRPWMNYRNGNYRICVNRYFIKEFSIPNGVTKIKDAAFRDCDSLTSVVIPDGVTAIGSSAFIGCDNLTSITIPNSVTEIGQDAFYDCNALTSIIIPDSVTSIGSNAFAHCNALTSVTIPHSVTFIGEDVFDACTNLKEIVVDSQAAMDSECFSELDSLITVTIGDNVTEIGNSAFYDCNALTMVTIGDNVTEIGKSAFYGCNSLTSVNIPKSVTYIGDSAFYDCESLASATISDSVTEIGQDAFFNCNSLTLVTIPDSVLYIGEYAFYGCDSLTSVNIPNSVLSIGSSVFDDCTNLKEVVVDSQAVIDKDYFRGCDALVSVTIGGNVTSVGDYGFYGCDSLTSVTIFDGVTSIEGGAFWDCSALTSVTIPNSIVTLHTYTFDGCDNLTDVYYKGTIAQWKKFNVHFGHAVMVHCSDGDYKDS